MLTPPLLERSRPTPGPMHDSAGGAPTRRHGQRFEIALASAAQRESIYRMRHAIYASELGQHDVSSTGRLADALDTFNHYLVLTRDERVIGFVIADPAYYEARCRETSALRTNYGADSRPSQACVHAAA